jgi:hypothetical protein
MKRRRFSSSLTGFRALLTGVLLFELGGSVAPAAEAAPVTLYNKTVVLTWIENRSQKSDMGEVKNSTTASDFRLYVSSAGRLFSRFGRENTRSGRSNKSEMSPDGQTGLAGVGQGQRSARFEGHLFISENRMKSGARRIQAAFDDQYEKCELKVIYGKEGDAPLYHRAMDGRMYHILSTEVLVPKCSIHKGNFVATN